MSKDEKLLSNVEPVIYKLVNKLCDDKEISVSAWLRKIALEELKRDGRLTDEIIMALVAG